MMKLFRMMEARELVKFRLLTIGSPGKKCRCIIKENLKQKEPVQGVATSTDATHICDTLTSPLCQETLNKYFLWWNSILDISNPECLCLYSYVHTCTHTVILHTIHLLSGNALGSSTLLRPGDTGAAWNSMEQIPIPKKLGRWHRALPAS